MSSAMVDYLSLVRENKERLVAESMREPIAPADLKASREAGLPARLVESKPDYPAIIKDNPITANFLAKTPVDDPVLGQVEKAVRDYFVPFQTPKALKGIGRSISAGFEKGVRGMALAGTDGADGNFVPTNSAVDSSMAWLINEEVKENIGFSPEAKKREIAREIEAINALDREVAELTPENLSLVEEGIRSGIQSLAQSAPGLIGSILTRSGVPMAASITGQVGFSSYAGARAAGLEPEQAIAYGAVDAAIEFATEKIPADRLVEMIPGGKDAFKKAMGFLAAEIPGEQLATAGQTINALAHGLDEELANAETNEERLEIQGRRQAVTFLATLVAGSAQAGAVSSVGSIANSLSSKLQDNAERSSQEQERIDAVLEPMKGSTLREGDPETFMQQLESLQSHYGEGQNLYVDGEVAAQVLEGVDDKIIDPEIAKVVDQMASAQATGADVLIPLEVYATYLAESEYHEGLRPHLRLSPDSLSQVELESGEVESELDRLVEGVESSVDFDLGKQAVQEKIAQQLTATGLYDASTANTNAQLYAEYAATQAQRNNQTPESVLEEMGLSIEGFANPQDAPLTLEQKERIENEQAASKGLDMSQEARMTRAQEMGFDTEQVWYHGTSGNFESFDLAKVKENFPQSIGIHLTSNRREASIYADGGGIANAANDFDPSAKFAKPAHEGGNVMPVYAKADNPLVLETDEMMASMEADLNRSEVIRKAYEGGHDAIVIHSKNGSNFISLNPSNIRSLNAAFDPEYSDSPLLLAQDSSVSSGDGIEIGQTADLFSPSAIPGDLAAKQTKDNFLIGYKQVEADTLQSGLDQVSTPEQVAHVIAPYRKHAQETMLAVVTDAQGKILNVIRHTKGLKDQSAVGASELVAAVVSTEGAANVWFAHNHPSNSNRPSRADLNVTEVLEDSLDGSDVTMRGHVILAGNDDAYYFGGEGPNDRIKIQPSPRGKKIPVTERVLRRVPPKDRVAITSSKIAEKAASEISSPDAILLFDVANKPVGSISLSSEDMRALRDGQRVQRIFKALDTTNASAVIIKTDSNDAADNVAMFFNRLQGVRVLDWISPEGSMASLGYSPTEKVGTFRQSTVRDGGDLVYEQDARRAQIDVFPDRAIIRLGEQSDLSSFLHESGHLFLEMEKRRARKGVTEDQGKILEWLGVDSFDAIEVKHHEQWARGFEAYLFKGQAPSVELRQAFRRFAQWLKQIYRTISGLDVKLTPEITGVMDRMLATDAQIEEVRGRGYQQFFRDPQSAGMTEVEWADYLDRQRKSKDRANETLQQKILGQLRRQTEAWWKDELASEIEASKEILLESPQYRAFETLRGNIETDTPLKLNREAIDTLLGTGKPKKRKANPNKVEPEYDSLLVAVAKLGGISKEDGENAGFDPDLWTGKNASSVNQPVFGKRIFKKDGVELDSLREALVERGYMDEGSTPNDLIDLMDLELRGDPQYASNYDYAAEYENQPVKHLPYRLRGLTAEDGQSPDDVAVGFGYTDAATMLTDFLEMPSLVVAAKENAERRMTEKYGDILNDGSLEREAEKAAHNEERGRLIFQELRALRKKQGTKPNIDRDMLKASAKGVVDRTPVKQLNAGRYRRAEVKAARAAERALAEGTDAATPKAQQLANFYLWKETTAAQEKAEKIRARLSKTQSRKMNGREVNPEYIRNIKLLLAGYDFTKGKIASPDKIQQVANWIRSQEVQVLDPILQEVMDGTLTKSRDLTFADLEGLDQMVRHLRFVGGKLSDVEKAKRHENYRKVAESIRDNARPKPKTEVGERIRNFNSGVFLHADSVLRELDGFEYGAAYNAIKRPIDDAVTQKLLPMQEKAGTEISDLYDRYYTTQELKENNRAKLVAGKEMSKWQMVSLALNWGNESSRQAVLQSKVGTQPEWTEAQVSQVLDRLDERDWKFVQEVWDYVDTYWGELSQVERRRNGVVPPKVEAAPYKTKFGIVKGGYYPLKYDKSQDVRTAENEAEDLMKRISLGQMAKASTKDGMTKQRVGSGGRPVLLEIDVFHRHVNETVQFIAMTEAVGDVNGVLASTEFREATADIGAQNYSKALDLWLRDSAVGEVIQGDVVSAAARHIRTAFSATTIGWNVGTILVQPLGLLQSMPVIGYKNVAKGLQALAKSPEKTIKDIQSISAFMHERSSTFNKDIRDTLDAMHGDPSKPTFVPDWMRRTFFAGIVWTQRYVDAATWLGVYEGSKDKFDNEIDLINAADRAVARSQASGIWSDRTPVERGTVSESTRQSEFVRMWTALGSYFFAKGNIAREAYASTNFKDPKDGAKFIADMLVLFTIEALLVGALKGTIPGEDEEESVVGFAAKETGKSVIGSIPFVREFGSVLSGFGGGPTYTSFVTEIGKFGTQAMQGEADEAFFKSMNNMGGMLFKYPSRQINRTVGALVDDLQGEDVDLLDYLMWNEHEG